MRQAIPKKASFFTLLMLMGVTLPISAVAHAQAPAAADEQAVTARPVFEPSEGGASANNSTVGYIDSALPGNQFRLRFDAAYDFRRPTRAEFFYARSGALSPGLPQPEPRIDYQDLSAYLELAANDRLSGFVELPWRFLNPEVNANANGLSDMNAGFKYAFLCHEDLVATFQFRTYIPTGDAHRGLGNHHVSLEPAFLFYDRLTDRLGLEGEFRYWVPIDGTNFAGDLVRYGLGLHYDVWKSCTMTVSPVAEFVGWTVLDGKESAVTPSGLVAIRDAAGDTIVNVKLGLRLRLDSLGDFYAGYGRSLTGERWYENTFRFEFRLFF
ncbi:MAG TPA: hypothetical protein VKU02_11785 [Gemmataceae bacterium]|nr:hypothetical protein [Gemmataceae bacterium]